MSIKLKTIRIIHVSPRFYSDESLITGEAKLLFYHCRAVEKAAQSMGLSIENSILSFGKEDQSFYSKPPYRILHHILKADPHLPTQISAVKIRDTIQDIDVVHIHNFMCHALIIVAAHARLLGKCVVGTDYTGEEHYLSYDPEFKNLFNFAHLHSDFAKNIYHRLNIPIKLIRGTIDTDFYKPVLETKSDIKRVLAIGRLLPHKGLDKIIEALPQELELTIVGRAYDKQYHDYLLSIIGTKKVNIIENLSDIEVYELLQKSGIFVHASTYTNYLGKLHLRPELLGLEPLEALSSGLTTLVSDTGALPELGKLPGCHVFKSVQELNKFLCQYADGTLPLAPPEEIHKNVKEVYGLEVYGRQMLSAYLEYLP